MPVTNMYVAVTHPCRLDAQQHLLALRLGSRIFPHFQRLAPVDDLHGTHLGVSQFPEPKQGDERTEVVEGGIATASTASGPTSTSGIAGGRLVFRRIPLNRASDAGLRMVR